jgi:hypothetical protein
MGRFVKLFFRCVVAVSLVGLSIAVIGLGVARATLPASSCTVSEAQIDKLVLEKMTQADVVAQLGCDGVHTVELNAEKLRIENVSWRGDVWPYAVFQGQFINGVLHGTDKRWVKLSFGTD